MELDKHIQDKLSGIFHRVGFKFVLALCSITNIEQFDAAVEWLRNHHPEEKPDCAFYEWCKMTITKWLNPMNYFSEEFMESFPLIAKKLRESEGNALIFLRMADFCGADINFLAGFVELIMKEHEDGQKVVRFELDSKWFHGWVDNPINMRCFTLNVLARYTQVQSMYFRRVFFPGLKKSGGGTSGIYFDWRSN